VELDGWQHYETESMDHDAERTAYLKKEHGIEVLRFSNSEVKNNFEGVCAAINSELAEKTPHPPQCEHWGTFPPRGGKALGGT